MADPTGLDLIRGLYEYHWWANRRLVDHAVTLGELACGRDLGPQFSFPNVRRLLAHIYGADWVWLARWKGSSPTALPGADITSLAELRQRWDETEREQRAYLDALNPADLGRLIGYRATDGRPHRLPLWPLLLHGANHATHHRSEVATMMTMIAGSPPPTDLVVYHYARTGQMSP